MKNFIYQNPVKILFGKGQIGRLQNEVPKEARVMLTYGGGSIFKNGVYHQVIEALKGYHIIEFGGIEPNPRFETLMKAVAIARAENIDFLLAVGGGSVIDGTKFIAAAVPFEGDPWDILSKGARIKDAVKLGTVLTLPATGSEMNSNSVVTNERLQRKLAFASPYVYPLFSILDPEVTYSLPKRQVANGLVDSFVHVMEQYMTIPSDAPLNDRLAESILKTLIELAPDALKEIPDYENRANLMWSSTMALNGLIGLGVPNDWATHGIGHELTALHGIDHAVTLAIVLPGLLRVMKDQKRIKLLQYADRVWNLTQGSEEERIEKCIQLTEDFFRSTGILTRLSEHNVGFETIDEIVKRFSLPGARRLGELGNIDADKIKQILVSRV